jgi:hypothetical protein
MLALWLACRFMFPQLLATLIQMLIQQLKSTLRLSLLANLLLRAS